MIGSRFFKQENTDSNYLPPSPSAVSEYHPSTPSPEKHIEILRKKFLEDCATHESFQCPISLDILKEPVITPESKIFSKALIQETLQRQTDIQNTQIEKEILSNTPIEKRRSKIETFCPVTTKLLTFSDLHSFSALENLVKQYEIINMNIRQEILAMTLANVETVKSLLSKYKEQEKKLVSDIESFKQNSVLEIQKKSTAENLASKISNIKNRFKIDINNLDHLTFWGKQTQKCFHSKGGILVIHKFTSSQFRVPTRVAAIMQSAQNKWDNPSFLLNEINNLRSSRPKFFNNPFSFLTRSAITKRFYKDKLDNLDFRSNELIL